MSTIADLIQRIQRTISVERLVRTTMRLVAVASPSGHAGPCADLLADEMKADGIRAKRVEAEHPTCPAVLATLEAGVDGPILQFATHIDTADLPLKPPSASEGRLFGTGVANMKAGLAAALEAFRVVRDLGGVQTGALLFTAHDLALAATANGRQLSALISAGLHGDAVLIPGPVSGHLPVAGRGSVTWQATVTRPGEPTAEVARLPGQPLVIAAAADLVTRVSTLNNALAATESHPVAGTGSAFVGHVHAGDSADHDPREAVVLGTRRWPEGVSPDRMEHGLRDIAQQVGHAHGVSVGLEYRTPRGPFLLDPDSKAVRTFQQCYTAISAHPLATGPKAGSDDGNQFWAHARVPAITHGPVAGGVGTTNEWVDADDLVRVATLYALAAFLFCAGTPAASA